MAAVQVLHTFLHGQKKDGLKVEQQTISFSFEWKIFFFTIRQKIEDSPNLEVVSGSGRSAQKSEKLAYF